MHLTRRALFVLLLAAAALLMGWQQWARHTEPSVQQTVAIANKSSVDQALQSRAKASTDAPTVQQAQAPDESSSALRDKIAVTTATATTAPENNLAPGSRLLDVERRARTGDRKAARDWVDAILQCNAALRDSAVAPPAYLSHFLNNTLEAQSSLRRELLGSLIDDCRMLFPATDAQQSRLRTEALRAEALRLWAASGDPFGLLVAAQIQEQWPPLPEPWRQQQTWAASYLNAADPQTLVDLAEVFSHGSRFNNEAAWRLVACDLGFDCAPGGALQRRLCLLQSACFAGSYEEELLQRLPPRQWQMAQAQRRALLEMLRGGASTAIFDVPPPGP